MANASAATEAILLRSADDNALAAIRLQILGKRGEEFLLLAGPRVRGALTPAAPTAWRKPAANAGTSLARRPSRCSAFMPVVVGVLSTA